MNLKIESCLTLLGRILLSLIFILSGLGKIGDWSGTASSMSSKGMVVRAIPPCDVGAGFIKSGMGQTPHSARKFFPYIMAIGNGTLFQNQEPAVPMN